MWQHYGQDGYAIVFNRSQLEAALSNHDVELMKVVYDEGEFRRSLRQDLAASMTARDDGWRGPSLSVRRAGLKGPEWGSEQEWRLVAHRHIRCGLGNGDEDRFSTAPSIFGPRPYVDLQLDDLSCISTVIAGPRLHAEERAESVGWLLRQHGLPPVVNESQSALRP